MPALISSNASYQARTVAGKAKQIASGGKEAREIATLLAQLAGALEGSCSKALQALVVDPLVGSFPQAKSILDEYGSAHAEFRTYLEA